MVGGVRVRLCCISAGARWNRICGGEKGRKCKGLPAGQEEKKVDEEKRMQRMQKKNKKKKKRVRWSAKRMHSARDFVRF